MDEHNGCPRLRACFSRGILPSLAVTHSNRGAPIVSNPGVRGHGQALIDNMISVHAVIGLIEAVGTVAILVAARRLAQVEVSTQRALTATLALALAIIGAVGSSPWPDGLEFSFSRVGLDHLLHAQAGLSVWNGYPAIGLLVGMSLAAFAAAQAANVRWLESK